MDLYKIYSTAKPIRIPEKIVKNTSRHKELTHRLYKNNRVSTLYFEYYHRDEHPRQDVYNWDPLQYIKKKILNVNPPLIQFLKKLNCQNWKTRYYSFRRSAGNYYEYQENNTASTRDKTFKALQIQIYDWQSIRENGIGYNENEIDQVDYQYINKIIRVLQRGGMYNNLEEQTEMPFCYITGNTLTTQNLTKQPIFKLWRSDLKFKSCNIDNNFIVSLIPVFKIEDPNAPLPVDITTGTEISKQSGYTTLQLLKDIKHNYGSLHDYSIHVIKINNGISEKLICIWGPFRYNQYFLNAVQDKSGISIYQSGFVDPLPYSTHPIYRSSELPTKSEHAFFGLEIEVDDKYGMKNAVKYQDTLLTPKQVLERYNWAITKDSSVGGFELKSPIIKNTVKWEEQIPKPIQILIDTTAKDARCGGHAHMSTICRETSFLQFQYFAWLFALIYPMRITNKYCKIHLKNWGVEQRDKYQWLRLRNQTIEFRIFPAVKNCASIYWRLSLLNKIHKCICKLDHIIKNTNETINIFTSETDAAQELREHVYKAKPKEALLAILNDPIVEKYFETRGNYYSREEGNFVAHMLLNKEGRTTLNKYFSK